MGTQSGQRFPRKTRYTQYNQQPPLVSLPPLQNQNISNTGCELFATCFSLSMQQDYLATANTHFYFLNKMWKLQVCMHMHYKMRKIIQVQINVEGKNLNIL